MPDGVKERRELACGVDTGLEGFGFVDGDGRSSDLDIDVCRAIAALQTALAFMDEGGIVETAPPATLFENRREARTRAVLSQVLSH